MMARKAGVPRRQFTSTMREDIFVRLQEESERTGVPMSKILDKAVKDYLVLQIMHESMRAHPSD